MVRFVLLFFFKQKTAYEMRISDWSSDVCSSDLLPRAHDPDRPAAHVESQQAFQREIALADPRISAMDLAVERQHQRHAVFGDGMGRIGGHPGDRQRSAEHTSELQSLMRTSYAVFCLKKKNSKSQQNTHHHSTNNIQ